VFRVRRIFRWAVAEELMPESLAHGLAAITSLRRGKTAAPETLPIATFDLADVEAVIPYLRILSGILRRGVTEFTVRHDAVVARDNFLRRRLAEVGEYRCDDLASRKHGFHFVDPLLNSGLRQTAEL
jgi:hypothetical protein